MIEIKSAEGKGRFVVAAERINESGVEVMCTEMMACGISDAYKKRICAYCMRWNPLGRYDINCKCNHAYYCSQRCKSRNESEIGMNHLLVCDRIRQVSNLKQIDKQAKSILCLLLNAIAYRSALENRDDIEQWIRNEIIYPAIGIGCSNDYPNDSTRAYPSILPTLQSHGKEWRKDQKEDWKRCLKFLVAIGNDLPLDAVFGESISGMNEESWIDAISAVESNAFGIFSQGKQQELAGRAVYPKASMFNHSCNSNCEAQRDGRNLRIIVKDSALPIEKGTELTLSYIDTKLPKSSRQYELKTNYFFDCECELCSR